MANRSVSFQRASFVAVKNYTISENPLPPAFDHWGPSLCLDENELQVTMWLSNVKSRISAMQGNKAYAEHGVKMLDLYAKTALEILRTFSNPDAFNFSRFKQLGDAILDALNAAMTRIEPCATRTPTSRARPRTFRRTSSRCPRNRSS
jgi:hypothetical protein